MASIQALIRALGAHIQYDSLVVVFGCGQDKDIHGMLQQLAYGADKIIFTKARMNPRACEPEDLLAAFAELSGKMAQTAPKLDEALGQVLNQLFHRLGLARGFGRSFFRRGGGWCGRGLGRRGRRFVLRYSTDIPGQALAYKLGSMKIFELREKAEKELAGELRREWRAPGSCS